MSDIKFITRSGLKSAKKAARHEIDGFLDFVFFKEEVLKRYESNKDFQVGENGTVMFGDRWGLFRGVYRVAKGYLGVHLGDLGEGLPEKELKHWKDYNVDPKLVPRDKYYSNFRSDIKRAIHLMQLSNQRVEQYLTRFGLGLQLKDKRIFRLDNLEDTLNHLQKTINSKTTKDDFQARIIFLNILLVESINYTFLRKVLERVDKDIAYSKENLALKEILDNYLLKKTPNELKDYMRGKIEPMKRLKLLKRFLLFMKLHHDIVTSLKIREKSKLKEEKNNIHKKIVQEFKDMYRHEIYSKPFKNVKYFTQSQRKIEERMKFLTLLNRLRNRTAAHGFDQREYAKILKELNVDINSTDYSMIYEKLIAKVSYDIDYIYFELIVPDPPILEHYEEYLKASIKELKRGEQSYKSYTPIFEEMASYLDDFPEFYEDIKKEIVRLHKTKRKEKDFIIALGHFIEIMSYSLKDKTQELVDFVLEGGQYRKNLTLAHLSHMVCESDHIPEKFFNKVYPYMLESLSNSDPDVRFHAQHLLWWLIQKCPNKLNKSEITKQLYGQKMAFKKDIVSFLRSEV